MEVLNFDYDLEAGFAWIEVAGKAEGEKMTVQCCVSAGNVGNEAPQVKYSQIKRSDCGHNWGLCGDANEAAFAYYGENRCMKALFAKAREAGFKLFS